MLSETKPIGTKVLDYEQLTVSTTAIALASVPSGTVRAHIVVEAQPLRYRLDGANPEAGVGFLAVAATEIELYGKETVDAFKAIRSGGTDSVISVHYFGE